MAYKIVNYLKIANYFKIANYLKIINHTTSYLICVDDEPNEAL